MKLKRISAGVYESTCGRVQVQSWVRPEADGYGPAGEVQWIAIVDGQCDDRFDTKKKAVEAAKETLKQS